MRDYTFEDVMKILKERQKEEELFASIETDPTRKAKRDARREKFHKRRELNRAIYNEARKGPCEICDGKMPAQHINLVLRPEFRHERSVPVSQRLRTWGEARMREEISKRIRICDYCMPHIAGVAVHIVDVEQVQQRKSPSKIESNIVINNIPDMEDAASIKEFLDEVNQVATESDRLLYPHLQED